MEKLVSKDVVNESISTLTVPVGGDTEIVLLKDVVDESAATDGVSVGGDMEIHFRKMRSMNRHQ